MQITLLQATPLSVADLAICKCYSNKPHNEIEKQQNRIDKVANVSKHSSTIEHICFSFDIDGISRACLQELARHRIASYTVKSTRYTLQELREEPSMWFDAPKDCPWDIGYKYLVKVNPIVDSHNIHQLAMIQNALQKGMIRDEAKYLLPEAYKTSLVMTINARALQNFLYWRTSSHALWEIQGLAKAMFEAVPDTHKFLFRECVT